MRITDRGQVEVTSRYVTIVDDLTAAWAFVMSRIDSVGPDPSVEIRPRWAFLDSEEDVRYFEVIVEGMVPEVTE